MRHLSQLSLFALLGLAACGSESTTATPPPPPPTTGSMNVTVTGLPPGKAAAVTVSGPDNYSTNLTATTTLTNLTPGSYSFVGGPVSDLGIPYEVTGSAATARTVTAGATVSASVPYDVAVLPRSLVDRFDEGAGSRFKVFYVRPSNGTDHSYDSNRLITRSIASGMRWLSTQAGGKVIRFDTADGKLDITYVVLPKTDAEYAAFGANIRDQIESDLTTSGFTGTDSKLFLVFYDGSNTANCGSSALPPITPGRVAAMYFTGGAAGSPTCQTNPFAATGFATPGYREFVMLHEMIHAMGGVSATAPDFVAPGHVNNDPSDLMYAGTQPWTPSRLDYLGRNYYNASGLSGGLWNLATSPFLKTP